ncbi:helix-turn-helix transcriptional regulator [Microbacterium oxydans]|uniref:helix-turn-helix transcriptional regulator n=1 Tax=Microbacterium oxydans TaxID=82380 RepID=UPI000F8F9E51|nr:hypothetical protein [Microbacterium oxydans]AZS48397.1 hypothetical protein CVS53_03117 [Microbacterium oxydans]
MEKYLTADQVCELIPGMTKSNLGQLRFTGKGPKFLKPTPRTVVYRESDVIAWLEASERTSTAQVPA